MKRAGILMCAVLAACGGEERQSRLTESLQAKAWNESLEAEGEVRAAANTLLNVPGTGWNSRVLVDVAEDGSSVKKGEVVARFVAPNDKVELDQAELELLRKALSEQAEVGNAKVEAGTLSADKAKVDGELTLSKRYVNADLSIFTRSEVLDALADVGFLTGKRGYLDWKSGQTQARSAAQSAVLRSQRDTVARNADLKRKSLSALDIVAPHDGVFRLIARWDGSKPKVGSIQWAGREFGSLPDLDKLLARFSVPEGRAFGLKTGLAVRMRLAGTGQEFEAKISSVGGSAMPKSQENPVKFIEFDALISGEDVRRMALKPGQALRGTVQLVAQASATTVPNIALVQEGNGFAVYTEEDGKPVKHAVVLGQRGPVRSELKSGVPAGAQVILLPAKGTKS